MRRLTLTMILLVLAAVGLELALHLRRPVTPPPVEPAPLVAEPVLVQPVVAEPVVVEPIRGVAIPEVTEPPLTTLPPDPPEKRVYHGCGGVVEGEVDVVVKCGRG